MSPDDVRAMQALLTAYVHRRVDIIGKLPLELVHYIFQRLPLYQLFQAQRVSRQWCEVLSAPQTVDLLLRPWFLKAETPTFLRHGSSTKAMSSKKAEYVDA